MRDFEETLLDFIKNNPNNDLKRIKKGLKINEDNNYLESFLNKLILKGIIYENKNGLYSLLENNKNLFFGKIHFDENNTIYVINEKNEKLIIPNHLAHGVFEKDLVIANKTGSINKLIKRNNNRITCEVIFEDGINKLIKFNSNYKNYIDVDQKELDKYGVGEILLINLDTNSLNGKILKNVGFKDEPDIDEKSIAYNYGFETEYSKSYLKELEKIPNKVNVETELKKGRKDLTNKRIFTVDSKDTKDIDDSIAIELLPNGNYKLYVNIADVSEYVKEGSCIDEYAYQNGTSVYMNDTVEPMFHPKISNGICSLHPNVNRLTITCEMIINKNGELVSYEIYESIINSKKKMTYEDVNEILLNNKQVDGYEEFIPDLKLMEKLSNLLEKKYIEEGYINFNKPDKKAKGTGENIEFHEKKHLVAQKIIENFMLLTNKTIAQHIFYRGLPFVYRILEAPNEENVNVFIEILEELGFEVKREENITSNKYLQYLTNLINKSNESEVLSELLLMNTMKKAKYSNLNIKHFCLAFKYYTHFTSPIRRYADLTVHRLLKLYSKKYDFDYNELDNKLKEICNHCTERSNAAEKAEKEAHEMRIAEYLENNIGKTFEGYILNITSTYIKVKTKEGFTGNINIEELKDDTYTFDNKTNSVKSENKNIIYKIGNPIDIVVTKANKSTKTVMFTTLDNYHKKQINTQYIKKKKK